jgi:acyl transferase domain-containing protein
MTLKTTKRNMVVISELQFKYHVFIVLDYFLRSSFLGEGLGLVLLKRLKDAERDNDKIYCVLHDILSNHDGCEDKKAYVVPSAAGQERLLNEIYARTQYDRKRIFYVEAHGTGTQVGDPIEANAIGKFFERSPFDPPLLIGSVKSNIGHTEGTAGVASLIKAVMSMKQRRIPPNMHFTALNPKIEAQRFNLHVVQTLVPFPPFDPDNENNKPVAIAINCFGIGGNNAHAIIEEYRPKQTSIITNGHSSKEQFQQHFLLIFSSEFHMLPIR